MAKNDTLLGGLIAEEVSATEFLESLHWGDRSLLTFHVKGPDFRDLGAIAIRDLEKCWPALADYCNGNLYFSINSFYEGRALTKKSELTGLSLCPRRTERLRWLNASYVDLDQHEQSGLRPDSLAELALQKVWELRLPSPAFLLFSGRGVWLFWLLNDHLNAHQPVPAFSERVELLQRVNGALIRCFSHLGADSNCSDVVRVTRVPGSKNSEVTDEQERVRCFRLSRERHMLTSLAQTLGVEPPQTKFCKKDSCKKDAQKVSAGRRRWQKPLEEFLELWRIRKKFNRGVRHYAMFIYALLLRRNRTDMEQIRQDCANLAACCDPPLYSADIARGVRCAIKAARNPFEYSISRSKTEEMLKITEEEQLHLRQCFCVKRQSRAEKVAERREIILNELTSAHLEEASTRLIPSREMSHILESKYQIRVSHTTILHDYKELQRGRRLPIALLEASDAWKQSLRCRSPSPLSVPAGKKFPD